MLQNSWNTIRLICGNHGDDHETEMIIHEGPHSLFFSCPKYVSIYLHDPARSCNNRLTLVDYEKMLEKINSLAYTEDSPYPRDIKGYSWKHNGAEFRVIGQKDGIFTVSVLNRKAMAK